MVLVCPCSYLYLLFLLGPPPPSWTFIFCSILKQLTAYRYILIYLSLIPLILWAFLICLPLNFHSYFLLSLVFVGGITFSLNVVFLWWGHLLGESGLWFEAPFHAFSEQSILWIVFQIYLKREDFFYNIYINYLILLWQV